MKKFLALVLALSLFALTACSGTPAPEQPTAAENPAEAITAAPSAQTDSVTAYNNLEFADRAYFMEGDYLKYYIVIHNANPDVAVELPSYRITATAADGSLLGTYDHTLSVIYPGQDFAFAGQAFSVSQAPANVEISLLPLNDYNVKDVSLLEHPAYTPLTAENTSLQDGGFYHKVTGFVKNDNDYAIDSAIAVVVFRDGDGNFVSAESSFVDAVAAGSTTPFEISIYSDNYTEFFDVYLNTWL